MAQVKSNLAPTGSAILFEAAEKGADFISKMEMTAEEAFRSLAPKMGRPNDKEIKAKEILLEMLKDGEMLSSDCEEKLEAAGFKKSTIKRRSRGGTPLPTTSLQTKSESVIVGCTHSKNVV